jgi:hypothetical protein
MESIRCASPRVVINKKENKMSKKNFEYDRRQPNHAPPVFNMDDLGYSSDDELFSLAARLEAERSQLLSKGFDTYSWEIEISYVRREQQLRKLRSERHSDWLVAMSHVSRNDDADQAGVNEDQRRQNIN